MPGFMFATGIENSCPTIAGGVRVDEMDKCGHYRRWKDDLAPVRELNLHELRWGPALYKTFTGPGRYDWAWVDDVLAEMQRLQIEPILDLCHFGVPDWLGNFQNPEFGGMPARRGGPRFTARRMTTHKGGGRKKEYAAFCQQRLRRSARDCYEDQTNDGSSGDFPG
jgi:hypothetical protein